MSVRLFVAAWPSPVVRDHLVSLARPDLPGVRWTRPGTWHVTLRFLGEVDEHAVDTVADAVSSLDASATEATLRPEVVALSPRVVAVPVGGLDALAVAVRAVTDACVTADRTRFRGHLTLARVRPGPVTAAGIADSLGRTGPVAHRWQVAAVDLLRSDQTAVGVTYRTVVRRSLD